MIYQIDSNRPYLQSIANFVIKSYDDFHNVRIIVPSTTVCTFLQNAFIQMHPDAAIILPRITPIQSFVKDSKLLYKLEQHTFRAVSYVEQKLLLMEVLLQEDSMSYVNELDALHIADELLSLFREIYAAGISVELLYNIVDADVASHWEDVSSFIVGIYHRFYDLLKQRNRVDDISLLHRLLDLEMHDINNSENIILVGLYSRDYKLQEYIDKVGRSKNGVVILPPVDLTHLYNEHISSIFFCYRKLLDSNSTKLYPLPYQLSAYSDSTSSIMLEQSDMKVNVQNIKYIEANNLASEIDFVGNLAISLIEDGVVIITENDSFVRQCELYFERYNQEVNNLRGKSIYYSQEVQFLLLLADVVYSKEVKKFITLLKTPYLISDIVYQFEMDVIRSMNVTTFTQMIDKINQYDDEHIRGWFFGIMDVLQKFENTIIQSKSFIDILLANINAVLELSQDIITTAAGKVLLELIHDITESSSKILLKKEGEYITLLRNILLNIKSFSSQHSNIIITHPMDAIFLDVSNVIICNCNEEVFPNKIVYSSWMSSKMRQILGLEDDAERVKVDYYTFYVLLNKENIYITRSITSNAKQNMPSKFLMTLLLAIEKANKLHEVKNTHIIDNKSEDSQSLSCTSVSLDFVSFPKSISATNIELLIRNPYGFYAKNILKLKKLRDEDTSLADFGNIVHEVIHKYTITYDPLYDNKEIKFLEHTKDVLQKYSHNIRVHNWLIKLENIAKHFIDFDTKRRANNLIVYSELYGETSFIINDISIKITAIADRIEITDDGVVTILDFKTGTLPSKQDVCNGLSPQLIIEAIILSDGGFNGIPSSIVNKLVYIKIDSAGQFIEQVIDITLEELEHHRVGLMKLLEYYTSEEAVFYNMPNSKHAPKYNDYLHFARGSNTLSN